MTCKCVGQAGSVWCPVAFCRAVVSTLIPKVSGLYAALHVKCREVQQELVRKLGDWSMMCDMAPTVERRAVRECCPVLDLWSLGCDVARFVERLARGEGGPLAAVAACSMCDISQPKPQPLPH
jgi:hypothetical protein